MSHGLLVLQLCCAALLGPLDGRGHRGRVTAERRLAALGALAWPVLDHGAALGPEAAARCRRLTAELTEQRLQAAAARLLPTGYPRLPWLSVHDGTQNDWLAVAKQRWVQLTIRSNHGWPEYRRATQLRVESWLREGRPVADVVADLDRMRDEEVQWIVANGAQCRPPLTLPPGCGGPAHSVAHD